MANDEVYEVVKSIYERYGVFILNVAEEIGWKKTIEIYGKLGQQAGKRTIQFMKTHGANTRLNEWAARGLKYYNSSGWKMDANVTTESIEFIIHKCPCFDGFLDAGICREEINRLCKVNHLANDKELKVDFPMGEYTSVVKPSRDEPCREVLRIPV